MTLLLAPMLLAVLACCPPDDVQIMEELNVLQANGSPLPEEITGSANDGLTLTLEFIPAAVEGMMFEREVRPPEEWRIRAEVTDADGVVAFNLDNEFRTYDFMGYCTTETRGVLEATHWISPDPPAEPKPGWHYRWGRVDLPETAGDYHIAISAFPTAHPEATSAPEAEWGEGVVIFETDISVEAGTHLWEIANQVTIWVRVTLMERQVILDRLKSVME